MAIYAYLKKKGKKPSKKYFEGTWIKEEPKITLLVHFYANNQDKANDEFKEYPSNGQELVGQLNQLESSMEIVPKDNDIFDDENGIFNFNQNR